MVQAPQCSADFIWWGFLTLLTILGYLLILFLKKGIIDRLDNLSSKVEDWMGHCHSCQSEMSKSMLPRTEFDQMMVGRAEAHKVLNGRLGDLEVGSRDISNKLQRFHDDLAEKMGRLSKTFVFRDAVISMRLDSLSDKVGVDKWTKEQEKALADQFRNNLDIKDGN